MNELEEVEKNNKEIAYAINTMLAKKMIVLYLINPIMTALFATLSAYGFFIIEQKQSFEHHISFYFFLFIGALVGSVLNVEVFLNLIDFKKRDEKQ